MKPFAVILAAIALAGGAVHASNNISIQWGKPFDLGRGYYARIHRLNDGRLMAGYALDGMVARFYTRGKNGAKGAWSDRVVVARNFTVTNGEEKVFVALANAEFAQLETGRIIFACNLRPSKCRVDAHPFAIAISVSDDGGSTWSPLKFVYKCPPSKDGLWRGCYEPFVLPGREGRAQIYFADESPYEENRRRYQDISFIETVDGGETWSKPRTACYTPKCRDGMPAVAEYAGWRFLSIEANPSGTRLHPQIVASRIAENWKEPVLAPSPRRMEPLLEAPDWRKTYAGAPYIATTKNYMLLSWQEHSGKGDVDVNKPIARVAVVPKKEIKNGAISTMRCVSSPPMMTEDEDRMMWPALCAIGNDSFLLVAECNGHVMAFPGRIYCGRRNL